MVYKYNMEDPHITNILVIIFHELSIFYVIYYGNTDA